jgi:hypothetical protein
VGITARLQCAFRQRNAGIQEVLRASGMGDGFEAPPNAWRNRFQHSQRRRHDLSANAVARQYRDGIFRM